MALPVRVVRAAGLFLLSRMDQHTSFWVESLPLVAWVPPSAVISPA